MESSHRWTFVGYFSTQQVPIGLPGRTDGQGKKNMYPPEGGDIIPSRNSKAVLGHCFTLTWNCDNDLAKLFLRTVVHLIAMHMHI